MAPLGLLRGGTRDAVTTGRASPTGSSERNGTASKSSSCSPQRAASDKQLYAIIEERKRIPCGHPTTGEGGASVENLDISNTNSSGGTTSTNRCVLGPVIATYIRGKLLGKGGFAKCHEMTDAKTQRLYAGKIIAKATVSKLRARQKLRSEIHIHSSLRHPNIVRFEHFFEDEEYVYILLELCDNQTMMELVKRRKRLTEPEARFYMMQILDALEYMHRNRVIHRDIKLGNLFLTSEMQIKLGDFGLAAKLEFDEERKKTICGTPNYIAPEVLSGKNGHSYEVDVWSVGVVLYTMLIGKPPFETTDVKTTYKRIKANIYTFPTHVDISRPARELIVSILNATPEYRPSVCDIWQSEFMQGPVPRSLPAKANDVEPTMEEMAIEPVTRAVDHLAIGAVAHHGGGVELNSQRWKATAVATRASLNSAQAACTAATAAAFSSDIRAAIQRRGEKPAALSAPIPKTVDTLLDRYSVRGTDRESLVRGSRGSSGSAYSECRSAASSTVTATVETMMNHMDLGKASTQTGSSRPVSAAMTFPSQSSEATGSGGWDHADVDEEEKGILSRAQHELATSFARLPRAIEPSSSPEGAPSAPFCITNPSRVVTIDDLMASTNTVPPDAWICKWVDYATKYGVGYQLSNGNYGVYFNDASKILLHAGSDVIDYVERRRLAFGSYDDWQRFTWSDHGDALRKKVTLLRHFRQHLDEHLPPGQETVPPRVSSLDAAAGAMTNGSALGAPPPSASSARPVHVKRWMRTRHAMIFRLSNRTIQVDFFDTTQLVLIAGQSSVTYRDKHARRIILRLNAIPNCTELVKRLRYLCDILGHLTQTSASQAPPKPAGLATTTASVGYRLPETSRPAPL